MQDLTYGSDEVKSCSWSVGQAMIDSWAELSEDFNPLHVDPSFAAGSQFGQTIAHGHLSVALVVSAIERTMSGHIGGDVDIDFRFQAPVFSGREYLAQVGPPRPDEGNRQVREITLGESGRVCVSATAKWTDPPTACNGSLLIDGGGTEPGPRLSDGRPILWAEDLHPGLRFRPVEFTADASTVSRYRAIVDGGVGIDSCYPPGLASVVARWSYLRDHAMPPGSVLLATNLHLARSARVGQNLHASAEVTSEEPARTGKTVLVRSEVRTGDVTLMRAGLHLRWPGKRPPSP